MSSKLRGSRLDTEVDRARAEGNWKRLAELLSSIKSKNSGQEVWSEVLEGESILETYLDDYGSGGHMATPNSSHKGPLRKAEELLREAIEERQSTAYVVFEAHLLLAKLYYFCAEFPNVIRHIELCMQDNGNTPFRTLRTLRLVAESYAIKGLAIEQMESDQGFGRALRCFEEAARLAISYVSELEKSLNSSSRIIAVSAATASSSTTVSTKADRMGDLLESTLERVPMLRLRQSILERKLSVDSIEWYRHIMTSLGDKSTGERLQQKLSRQLADLLMRGFPDGPLDEANSVSLAQKNKNLGFYAGSQKSFFSPASRMEEIVLLLLISEVLSTREVILSRSDDLSAQRHQSLRNAKSVYNLLTLVLSSLRQYRLLATVYERAMKFANQDRHLWFQFALSLLCEGRHLRASRVLQQCVSIERNDENACVQYMLAAKIELEQLGQYDLALQHAEKALELSDENWLTGRCLLLRAMALGSRAQCAVQDRREALAEAVSAFDKAVAFDQHDSVALFHAALQHAIVRDLDVARELCLRSLELNTEQPLALMLNALIFTAQADLKTAYEVVVNALKDFPKHYGLLVLRLQIEAKFGKVEEALETSRHLLDFWRRRTESDPYEDVSQMTMIGGAENGGGSSTLGRGDGSVSRFTMRELLPTQLSVPANSSALDIADNGSILASTSANLSEYGGAPSTVSDSLGLLSSIALTPAQANIWVELSEMFLNERRVSEVAPCVEEACTLFPNSHQALYLKARLLCARAEKSTDSTVASRLRQEAKSSFLGSLAILPSYLPSLAKLAALYTREGNVKMAEKMLKEAVRVDPLHAECWQELGRALAGQDGEAAVALQCFETALALERSSPLIPFSVIPRSFPAVL